MTKSGNYAKKLLAVSAGVVMLGSIAATGFAGANLFKASAEGEDPNKLYLTDDCMVDAWNSLGYKIEKANADNDWDEHPYNDATKPYDYVITLTNKLYFEIREGNCYINNSANTEILWDLRTADGKPVNGSNHFKYSKAVDYEFIGDTQWDALKGVDDQSSNAGDTNNGGLWLDYDLGKSGQAVITATFAEHNLKGTCETHGSRTPCTCWLDGDGQGESLIGKYLRVLYRYVDEPNREFTFTGASKDQTFAEQGVWLRFNSNDVPSVSTADGDWTRAERFTWPNKAFLENIYFLQNFNSESAPTEDDLAGKDLYTLMRGENVVKDGWLFQLEVRDDHIEIYKGVREAADDEEGTKVNFEAGDAFYLKSDLHMLTKDANTNWCDNPTYGGVFDTLARNQMFVYDGQNWSNDELAVTLKIDNNKALVEEGANVTITPSLEKGKYAADDQSVTWTSENEEVATVENGVITGVKAGTATITAKLQNGSTQTVAVTVVSATDISNIKVARRNETLYTAGDKTTAQIQVEIEGGSKAPQNVTYSTSDAAIATVSESGLITAVGEGTAKITVTAADGEHKAEVTVKVIKSAEQGGDDNKDDDKNEETENKGCGSVVYGGAAALGAIVLVAGVALVLRKKNENK